MLDHLKRLSWPMAFFIVAMLITVAVGISLTNLEVIVFKFLVFCPAVILVHLTRKTLFPYIDLQALLEERDAMERTSAAAVFGVFMFYVVSIYALTQTI